MLYHVLSSGLVKEPMAEPMDMRATIQVINGIYFLLPTFIIHYPILLCNRCNRSMEENLSIGGHYLFLLVLSLISEKIIPTANIVNVMVKDMIGGIFSISSASDIKIFDPINIRTEASAYFK